MQANKNKIIFGVGVAIIFLTTVFVVYNAIKPKSPASTVNVSQSGKQEAQSGQSLNELDQCMSLDYDKTAHFGEQFKDSFYVLAENMAKRKESYCDSVDDQEERRICLSHYYKFLTLRENTDAYISKLAALGEDVTIGKAYLKKDASLCEGISDEIQKNTCKAMASLDKSYCKFDIKDSVHTEACLSVEDEKGKTKRGCDANKEKAQSLCLDAYNIAKAFQNNNIDECYNIDNVTGMFTRLYCLSFLSSNPKEEINKFYRENACYEKYATLTAKEKNDPSLCEKIPLKDGHNKVEYENCVNQFK